MSESQIIEAVRRALEEGSVATLATVVEASENIGAKILVDERGARFGDLGNNDLNEAVARRASVFLSSRAVETSVFKVSEFAPALASFANTRIMFERVEAEPRLVICGAGHVGASLARIAALVGYKVALIDDRAEFVSPEKFSEETIKLVATKDWTSDISKTIGTGRGVSAAIVTRGHSEDEICLRAALASRPDYVGMIGSKRRTRIVLSRLKATGVDESLLEKVYAPIGLDIGAVSPEEVALAILAEIIAVRRGGTGAPLSLKRSGRISGDLS
jgi:xanthine dehydrogenase accessory factor